MRDKTILAKATKTIVRTAILAVCMALPTGCQNGSGGGGTKTGKAGPSTAGDPARPAGAAADPARLKAPPTNGIYSAQFDAEFRQVFSLASKNQWDEAEVMAGQLLQKDPQNDSIKRLSDWVSQQREFQREKAIEDKIRDIEAKNSDFNQNVRTLLTDRKDRGLPPRKDVRDAVQKIESEPYIPENFGKVIRQKSQLFDMESPQGRMAAILDKEISVHLDNVTLEAIIFNVGQAEGINFVADKSLPAFKQTLSVNLNKVKLSEFLRYVARNLDVQFQVADDLIWIVDAKDPKKILEETRVYRLKYGFLLPAQFGPTEVSRVTTTANNVTTVAEKQTLTKFVNDNAPSTPSLEGAIKDFFTGSKFLIDYERNLIVARGTPEQLEVLDEIVREFDKPLQQVLIESRFVTITEAAFIKLGLIWESSGPPAPNPSADFTGLGDFGALQTHFGSGLQESFTNILNRPNLTATLTAIQQDGESQTLSAPRLTLVNNLPAMINDGKVSYYYEEYTVKQTITERSTASSIVPQGKPTKITSGASLYVLASIGGDGQSIVMALNPKINQDVEMKTALELVDQDAGGGKSTFALKLPEYRTQELATRVVIKSGQTVVMGGVLEREQRKFVESVPVLGSLPIVGAAFRRRSEIDKPRYLLIFVTATLLSENGELVIPDEVLTDSVRGLRSEAPRSGGNK